MRTIIKVDIRTCQIYYKVGVYIYESESIAIRNRNISEYGSEHRKAVCTGRETQESGVYRKGNTGKWCVQEGKHRNAMSEHGTGTGTRIRTGTGTGTKPEMVILRTVLMIPEFECGTKFWESQESV